METTQQQVIDLAITHETHGFCYAYANNVTIADDGETVIIVQ